MDVLQAAKELARRENSTAGRVISRVFRKGLQNNGTNGEPPKEEFLYKNGIPVLPHREGEIVTMEHIRKLMDEEDL